MAAFQIYIILKTDDLMFILKDLIIFNDMMYVRINTFEFFIFEFFLIRCKHIF
jgi:hypothetical protein